MEESVSYIHSLGALICASAICLAAVVSYLALRSRGRANRGGINHGEVSTSVLLCKVCCQLVKNAASQDYGTKEWMCSACSGCSHSTEVSPDADGDDQSADLEIQHTLGSLAISHTNTPQSRDSPRSWLHLIEDLNLLPDHACHQNDPTNKANDDIGNKHVADFSSSPWQPSSNTTSTDSDVERSTANIMANSCTRKPLIQPAKLQVRRRRFSISSATAALSLTGSGWGFSDHVTNKDNGRSVNGEADNPFLHVPDSRRCMNIRRNPAVIERQDVNSFQQGGTSCHKMSSHFGNGNGLTNNRMLNNHNTSLQDSNEIFSLSGLNLSSSHAAPTLHTTHHPQQQSTSSSLSPSPLPCPSNQPQSTGTPAAATLKSRPPSNRVRCVVGALILLSVTGNIILLLLLFVYVYKPSHASPVWVDAFSDL